MKNRTIVIILCAALPFMHACGDCAGVGLVEIRPGSVRTINVGASFTAEYWVGGTCGGGSGAHLDRQDMRWWTIDTLVVQVDSASGLVHAIGPGDAHVWIRYPGSPAEERARIGQMLVHVY